MKLKIDLKNIFQAFQKTKSNLLSKPTENCFSEKQLLDYCTDRMEPEEEEKLHRHINSCLHCNTEFAKFRIYCRTHLPEVGKIIEKKLLTAISTKRFTGSDIFEKCSSFTIAKQLMEADIYPYFKKLASAQDTEVVINGKKFIMLGSDDYLGLANDPRMKEAAINALKKYGTGCTGSRFLNGNTDLHLKLERRLASFINRESALIYATGYQMKLGAISALIGKDDFAIVDKLSHASTHDGCRLSGGEIRRFAHNNPLDLERVLQQIAPNHGKIVIVEGVSSITGDICPLPEIIRISKKYGARIMLDDSNAIGVLGRNGKGTCERFNLIGKEIDFVVGSCSKTLASMGGFVAGDEENIHFIQHMSRSMIFSAALPPSCAASALEALNILEAESGKIKQLWDNSNYLRNRLRAFRLNMGAAQTPIITVILGNNLKTFVLWKALYGAGIFTIPVVSPIVPPKNSFIRISVSSAHTKEQLDKVFDAFSICIKNISKINSTTTTT